LKPDELSALAIKVARDEKFASEIFCHETLTCFVAVQNHAIAEGDKPEADQRLRGLFRARLGHGRAVAERKHRIKNL
jgi:hypothetical protein